MRIEVTAEDIAKGRPCDPGNCAIACAMRRIGFNVQSIGGVANARGPVAWMLGDGPRKIQLPPEAGVFARAFDQGVNVDAVAFEIPGGPLEGTAVLPGETR